MMTGTRKIRKRKERRMVAMLVVATAMVVEEAGEVGADSIKEATMMPEVDPAKEVVTTATMVEEVLGASMKLKEGGKKDTMEITTPDGSQTNNTASLP